MGQHKHNPVAIAAKEGKIPPKKAPMGAAAQRRCLQALVSRYFRKKIGF